MPWVEASKNVENTEVSLLTQCYIVCLSKNTQISAPYCGLSQTGCQWWQQMGNAGHTVMTFGGTELEGGVK